MVQDLDSNVCSDEYFSTILNSIIKLVPQWYKAEVGKFKYELKLYGVVEVFYSLRPLTPKLKWLFQKIQIELPDLVNQSSSLCNAVFIEFIQEYFALKWLSLHVPTMHWQELFDYFKKLANYTHENSPVLCNLIISDKIGVHSITSNDIQKILAPLTHSLYTYFLVDHKMRYVEFNEVDWQDIKTTEYYKFHPEFLHPFFANLKLGEISAHLTTKRDWVFLHNNVQPPNLETSRHPCKGLLAMRRKGQWELYDSSTLKNTLVDALEDSDKAHYRVGCNLFEILFDLSFKRHGALLIYDPYEKVLPNVLNSDSLLSDLSVSNNAIYSMFTNQASQIAMGSKDYKKRKKRIFLEFASVDGAVIFNKEKLLAFGAMIKPHFLADKEQGARSTAAYSAYLYGGYPFKISADGDITVYFTSYDKKNNKCEARLNFGLRKF